jgi:hypothetical protein
MAIGRKFVVICKAFKIQFLYCSNESYKIKRNNKRQRIRKEHNDDTIIIIRIIIIISLKDNVTENYV